MVKESVVDYYLICAYCEQEYMATMIMNGNADWDMLNRTLGKKIGWCGKCAAPADYE